MFSTIFFLSYFLFKEFTTELYAQKSTQRRRYYCNHRSAICALCFAEMTLVRARKRNTGKRRKYSRKATASAPSRPEASSSKATKRLASSTSAAPRKGRNLDFFSCTWCSIENDCPGRQRGGERGQEGRSVSPPNEGMSCRDACRRRPLRRGVPRVLEAPRYSPGAAAPLEWRQAVDRVEAATGKKGCQIDYRR